MKNAKYLAAGLLFLVPWSFLALWWDETQRSMLGHLVLLLVLVLLSRAFLKQGALWLGAAGMLVSGIVSFLCAGSFLDGSDYFKPFTAQGLVNLITAASLLIYGIFAFKRAKQK